MFLCGKKISETYIPSFLRISYEVDTQLLSFRQIGISNNVGTPFKRSLYIKPATPTHHPSPIIHHPSSITHHPSPNTVFHIFISRPLFTLAVVFSYVEIRGLKIRYFYGLYKYFIFDTFGNYTTIKTIKDGVKLERNKR